MESGGNYKKGWGKIVIPCPVLKSKNPKGIRLRLNKTSMYDCSMERKVWNGRFEGKDKREDCKNTSSRQFAPAHTLLPHCPPGSEFCKVVVGASPWPESAAQIPNICPRIRIWQ